MLLTIVDSFRIANTMQYATTYVMCRAELHLYIYCRKAFGEHFDIQIAIDYEMKLKIHFISISWLNLFEYKEGYVYIIYL